LLQELCEGNLITFALLMNTWTHFTCAFCFAQPGHWLQWLGPVTRPGWLGLAQPIWAKLGPAPKK
jgi:hypothetical protein